MGLIPFAPGTFGSLVAYPFLYFYYLLLPSDFLTKIIFIILIFSIGVRVSNKVNKILSSHDYKGIVWDETVGFLIVLLFVPNEIAVQIISFLLFRFFDIFKPFPINLVDKKIQNGFGIMFDDVIAAIYSVISVNILIKFI